MQISPHSSFPFYKNLNEHKHHPLVTPQWKRGKMTVETVPYNPNPISQSPDPGPTPTHWTALQRECIFCAFELKFPPIQRLDLL